jgi:hypothetical protein
VNTTLPTLPPLGRDARHRAAPSFADRLRGASSLSRSSVAPLLLQAGVLVIALFARSRSHKERNTT